MPAVPDASSAPRSASAEAASRASVAVRWAVGVGAATMTAIGLVLLFLLTLATNNRALYERNYAWLFGVNVLVAALLLGVLVWIGARLLLRLRKGRFGSRLLVKLAAIFALVGLMPGVLIYVVSYQFVTRSIESWFDVKVEGALVAGVNLARVSLESQAADMAAKTRTASAQVAQGSSATVGLALERIRDQLGATDVVLWNAAGQPIGSAGQSRFSLNPERPSTALLRSVREQRAVTQIEGLDDIADPNAVQMARVKVLVLVTNPGLGLLTEPRFLQATLPLPPRAGVQRHRGPGGQPRVPGACAGARRPAPHVCGHAHTQPLSGSVWRSAAGGAAGQPAGAAVAGAGRGRSGSGGGQPQPESCLAGQG